MTLNFSGFRAVVNIHVPAKFHSAKYSSNAYREKNSDENSTVRRYRADGKYSNNDKQSNRKQCTFPLSNVLRAHSNNLGHPRAVFMRDNISETCVILLRFMTSGKLDLRPFKLKIGTLVTPALGNVHTNFGFIMHFFVFELKACTGRTDEQDTKNVTNNTAAISYEIVLYLKQ